MKITAMLAALSVLLLPCAGFAAAKEPATQDVAAKIRITFETREVVIAVFDNPAGRDFLALLPLDVEFEDYAGLEKITYLPRKLQTSGSPTASQTPGDFTYYAPWGNLAVFYKGFGSNGQLYVLGKIESGKESLARMTGGFSARMERIER